jgi:hypothetical protein
MIQSRARLILLVVSNCTRRTRRLEKHPPDAPKRDTKLKARKTNDVTHICLMSLTSHRERRVARDVLSSTRRFARPVNARPLRRASHTHPSPAVARAMRGDARRTIHRAPTPSADATASRMRSIFSGESTYPSPFVSLEWINVPPTDTSSAPEVVGVGSIRTVARGNFAAIARSMAVAKRR